MQRRPGGHPPLRCLWAVALAVVLAAVPAARAQAPHYDTMASQPDPLDFVRRTAARLTLLDEPLRFGGVNISWLGLRQDAGRPARRPTAFEVRDALATAQALGAAVIRLPGLAATAGCALCLETAPGQINADAMAQLDLVLATARDLGLKVILPLADSGGACRPADTGVICADGGPGAFFTDPGRSTAFLARVRAILGHVNARNAVAYVDDPTILAWENCDGCGAAADPDAVSAWVEAVGQAIKAADRRHLYEDGAFAGRLGHGSAHKLPAGLFATPSVDIVGDRLAVHGDAAAVRGQLAEAAAGIARAGRAYVLDDFGWAPSAWPAQADLDSWLGDMARDYGLAGGITGDLQAHAEGGGFLPGGPGALYFPGRKTAEMDLPTMQARGRALRRFFFAMAGLIQPPSYLLPPPPTILSAANGRVVWQGAAGAASYSIERSPDPASPYTWTTVCDGCVTDDPGIWQDPDHADGPQWYRVMPININGHRSVPSAPAGGN